MTWARVCDSLHSHPKALDAGLEAMGFWVLALSYCGAQLTDGHVKRNAAIRLVGDAVKADQLADQLVAVGLWELHPSGDGWQVHHYAQYNFLRAEVLAQREAKQTAGRRGATVKWERERARSMAPAMAPAIESASALPSEVPMLPIPSLPDPIPERGEGPSSVQAETSKAESPNTFANAFAPDHIRNVTHDRCGGLAVAALCEGISSVTGKPFARPYKGSLDIVLSAFEAHAPDLSSRVEWARERGAAYARQENGKVNVLRWADFVNSPEPRPGAPIFRNGRMLQPAPSDLSQIKVMTPEEEEEELRKAEKRWKALGGGS